ncbi:MAG: PAS domain S-box protein, partial [Bacteroidales bacterium]
MSDLPNILIVDDIAENLALLKRIINKNDASVISALSGLEALQKIQGLELALAIIDIRMPEMDGFELAIKLNQERADDKVSIIFLTADYFSKNEVVAGYDAGALDFISKPIDNQILQTKINVYLDLFRKKKSALIEAEAALKWSNLAKSLKNTGDKYLGYFENAPNGVFVVDKNGRYVDVNKAGCFMTGYSEEEILQMSIPDFLPKESLDAGLALFRVVVEKGEAKGDLPFRHKSGVVRWWTIEAIKVSEERFLSFTLDITHRIELEELNRKHQLEMAQQNEELLRTRSLAEEAAKKYTALYDFAPIGFFTLSQQSDIHQLNLSAAQLLGQDRTALLLNKFNSYISEDSKHAFKVFLDKVFQSATKQTVEVKLEISGKGHKHMFLVGAKIEGSSHSLINATDISLHKHAEEIIRADEINKAAAESRKQAEKKLRDSEFILRQAQDISRTGYYITNIETGVWISSPMLDDIFGIDSSFDKNITNWSNLIVPDFREEALNHYNECIRQKTRFELDYKVIRPKDGNEIWVSAFGEFDFGTDGKPLRLIGTIQDITSRKQIEEKLRSSETNFRDFFESISDIIFIGNEQGEVIYANHAAQLNLDISLENLQSKHVWDFYPASASNEARAIIETSLTGLQKNCNLPLKRNDGTLIPVESHCWPGKWNGENCVFIFSKDQSEIQASLRKFNKFFYNNPALLAISSNGIFTEVNDKFLTTLGYAEDEVIGKSSAELNLFVKPEKHKIAAYELEKHGTVQNFELSIRTKSGKILNGLFSGEVIDGLGGKLYLTVMNDITKHKQTEKELYKKELLYRTIIETANEGIIVAQGTMLKYANPKMMELTGMTQDELLSKHFLDFIHPEDQRIVADYYMKRVNGEEVPSHYQIRGINKSGQTFWFEVSGVKIDWQGQPATMNFLSDITTRKQTEMLREQQLRFTTALNELAGIIILKENRPDILENANRIISETLHVDTGFIYTISFTTNRISPLCEWQKFDQPEIAHTIGGYASLDLFLSPLTEIRETQNYLTSSANDVNEYFEKDNSGKILHDNFNIKTLLWYPLAFSHNDFYLLTLNQIQDFRLWTGEEIDFLDSMAKQISLALIKLELIEEKILAENALRKSEALLSDTQQIAQIGSWSLEKDTLKMKWSQETYRIFGYKPFTINPSLDAIFKRIHPDDLEPITKSLSLVWDSKSLFNETHRIISPNGNEKFVQTLASINYDNYGMKVQLVGSVQDITAKKKAEKELQSSFQQLRDLTQHIESVREGERVSISRELHDDLGQSLTAIKIDLNLMKQNISEKETVLKINKISDLVGDTIKTVQRLTSQLRPDIIDDLGLEAALDWYTSEFAQRNGIQVLLKVGVFPEFSSVASLNIFRIVQEALTNIARHSKATHVDI